MKKIIFIFLATYSIVLSAQVFTRIDPNFDFEGIRDCHAVWCDTDNDGDLDLSISGELDDDPYDVTRVYENIGNSFPGYTSLLGVRKSWMSWGDTDGDGDLDMVLMGDDGGSRITQRFSNYSGNFSSGYSFGAQINDGSSAWADVDRDGDQDVIVSGMRTINTIPTPNTILYLNRGGNVFEPVLSGIINLGYTSVAWGDYDNDGDPDLLISGYYREGYLDRFTSRIYRNDDGVFTDIEAGLTGVAFGSNSWGDYDSDGDLDIVITGKDYDNLQRAHIYRNDDGVFTDINAQIQGVERSSSQWGDYDNDGDLDLLITGDYAGAQLEIITKLYRNDAGIFTDSGIEIFGVHKGCASWGDYDNDGDLDIFLAGEKNGGLYEASIYRNNTTVSNARPSAPTGLTAVVNDGKVLLSWQASTDDHTAQTGLTYNIYVKKDGATVFRKSPESSTADGKRRIVSSGNSGHRTSYEIELNESGVYKWGVQAIDNSYKGSSFSIESSFRIGWSFSDSGITLPGVRNGDCEWGDYDNDGDLDFAVSGLGPISNITKIYRNSSTGFSEAANLTGLQYGTVKWGDYDSDGDLDLFINGCTGTNAPLSKLLRNDSGTFTDTFAPIKNMYHADACWGDFDNDGDLDLLEAGFDGQSKSTKLYRNNDTVFEEVPTGLPNVDYGTVNFIDYDNDGDLDISISGSSDSGIIFEIYRNDNGSFTNISAGLTPVCYSSVAWGDYDNDGDPDILISGYNGAGIFTSVFRNDAGVFTDINAGLPGVNKGCVFWGDLDSDGDLDVFFSGTNSGNTFTLEIYKNNSGVFSDAGEYLPPMGDCSASLGDYNNDGRPDILICGTTLDNNITKIFKNNSASSNVKPSAPANLNCIVSNGNAIFTWDKASDDRTPADGLSYNLYLRAIGSENFIKPPMSSTTTGFRKISSFGNSGQRTTCTIENIEDGMYNWSVQAIDNSYSGSLFSQMQVLIKGNFFAETSVPVTGVHKGSLSWGDLDNDNDLDLLLTGYSSAGEISEIYTNSNGIFTKADVQIPGVWDSSSSLTDFDNDGDLDFIITGYSGSERISRIYSNDGTGNFFDTGADIPGVNFGSSEWGDYDNDGDADILITGWTGSGRITEIFRNDNGAFVNIDACLTGVNYGTGKWADYDRDGDLDILLSGWDGEKGITKLYRNDKGYFTEMSSGLKGLYYSSLEWCDYNNDGWPDIFICGTDGSVRSSIIYKNSGSEFIDIGASIPGLQDGGASWGDIDNDGDSDLLITGKSDAGRISKIFKNSGGDNFEETEVEITGAYWSDCSWSDYDNDGNLDFMVSGYAASAFITKLYTNSSYGKNYSPGQPTNLISSPSGAEVTLSWSAPFDIETGAEGLSYNVYIGTEPGSQNIMSAGSDLATGYLRTVSQGNAFNKNKFRIEGLQSGTYYWSVQAVDRGFCGSEFAEEGTFTYLVPPMNLKVKFLGNDVYLTWDAVSGASAYRVFGSDDPFGEFTDISGSGTFGTLKWYCPMVSKKRFYYIKAFVK